MLLLALVSMKPVKIMVKELKKYLEQNANCWTRWATIIDLDQVEGGRVGGGGILDYVLLPCSDQL